jgi:transposase
MCSVRFTISPQYRKGVERQLKTARQLGRMRQVHYLLAILAVMDGQSFAEVAVVLRVHEKTVAVWVRLFCCYGIKGAPCQKPTGRPPKMTPTQKEALAQLIDEGPVRSGFSGACWRSPMIQQVIYDRFGVFYNVFYIAQLLKNLGFRGCLKTCQTSQATHHEMDHRDTDHGFTRLGYILIILR